MICCRSAFLAQWRRPHRGGRILDSFHESVEWFIFISISQSCISAGWPYQQPCLIKMNNLLKGKILHEPKHILFEEEEHSLYWNSEQLITSKSLVAGSWASSWNPGVADGCPSIFWSLRHCRTSFPISISWTASKIAMNLTSEGDQNCGRISFVNKKIASGAFASQYPGCAYRWWMRGRM